MSKRENKMKNKRAFTLAEMMVVLLIMSLITAAFVPVLTRRSKQIGGGAGAELWTLAADTNTDIFSREGATQGVAIGINSFNGTAAKLLINTANNSISNILFKQNNVILGRLMMDGNNNVGLGNINFGAVPATITNASAFGSGASAQGGFGSAFGSGALADSSFSTALGAGAQATGGGTIECNTAIGRSALATSRHAIALGFDAQASTNDDPMAIGTSSRASSPNSIAIGNGALATTTTTGFNTAIGVSSVATGDVSTAIGIGDSTQTLGKYNYGATSPYSIALGYRAAATSTTTGYNTAIGTNSTATGNYSSAIGTLSTATGVVSTAIGISDNSKTSGAYNFGATSPGAIAIGYKAAATTASTGYNIAVGSNAIATEDYSTAVGYNAKANGGGLTWGYNTAIGANANASNNYSTAIGTSSVASAWDSIALGHGAKAENQTSFGYSMALGYGTHANGDYSIAIGVGDTSGTIGALNDYSTAIGYKTNASSNFATSLGSNSVASGTSAVALGARTVFGVTPHDTSATGNWSTAVGTMATASADYAIAIGPSSALHEGSVAIGAHKLGASSAQIATTTAADQIVLGTTFHTVYIPGKLTVTGVTTGPGANWTVSDRRLKNVGGKFNDGLNKIRELKTYNYTFKKDKEKTQHVGVIAQDLQKVFPNAVKKGDDGYLAIRQDDMFYAMINSIKQLDTMVQGLVNDFKALVVRVQSLDDKIIALVKVDQIQSKKIKELELKNKALEKQNKSFEARLRKLEQK